MAAKSPRTLWNVSLYKALVYFLSKWYKQIHDLFHTGYLQNLHRDDNRLYIVHVVDSRYGFENKGELKFFSINKLHKYFSNDELTSSSNVFKSM